MPTTHAGRLKSVTAAARRMSIRSSAALPVLAVLAFGVPLHLGGAPALAVPLWASVAVLAVWLTGIDLACARRDPLLKAALVLMGVAALQLVPLPPFLLRLLDPVSAEASAGALAPFREDRGGVWRALHLDPGNGYAELQYLVGLTAAYLAARRVTARGYGDAVFDAVAGSSLWIAIVALAHRFGGFDKVYDFYVPAQAAPPILSPILNPNHLAAFTGLGAVLWVGRAAEAMQPAPRIANGVGALLCAAVCALTLSRGGVLAAGAGFALVLLSIGWIKGTSRCRSSQRMFDTTLLVLGVASASLYVAWEALRTEYAGRDVSKLGLMLQSLRVLAHHPVLGTGSGGLHAAASLTPTLPGGMTVERAENLVADLAIAFGPVAAAVALAFAARWLWTVRPPPRQSAPTRLAAYAAMLSLVLHEMVDFALWLGATGYAAALLAGLLSGEHAVREDRSAGRRGGTVRAFGPLALVASIAAGLVTARSPQYLDRNRAQAALNGGTMSEGDLRVAMIRHPSDPYLPLAGGVLALRAHDPRALRFVNRALLLAPRWAEPHFVLSRVLAARGLRSQALVELRSAVELAPERHVAMGLFLMELHPDAREVERTTPPGPAGAHFLTILGEIAGLDPIGDIADRLLLARSPDDLGALTREATRAERRHDVARQQELYERLVRAHPRAAVGHVGLATMRAAAGDHRGAEAILRAALRTAPDPRPYLVRLAETQAALRDTEGMRRSMAQLLELAGADIDGRIRVFGRLGSLEESLGNDASALAAYERADAMAYPAHPYLGNIIGIAHRLDDIPRLRGACHTASDQGLLSESQGLRTLCARVDRASPGP
jgi:tetratricopeptide (TPR) repeat protein